MKEIFKKDDNKKDDKFTFTEMIQYVKLKKFNINNILSYIIYFFKLIVAISFLPLILIFIAFNNQIFLKIFKQVIVILYFLFFIIFLYTIFNQNKIVVNSDLVIKNIHINKNKIKNF